MCQTLCQTFYCAKLFIVPNFFHCAKLCAKLFFPVPNFLLCQTFSCAKLFLCAKLCAKLFHCAKLFPVPNFPLCQTLCQTFPVPNFFYVPAGRALYALNSPKKIISISNPFFNYSTYFSFLFLLIFPIS